MAEEKSCSDVVRERLSCKSYWTDSPVGLTTHLVRKVCRLPTGWLVVVPVLIFFVSAPSLANAFVNQQSGLALQIRFGRCHACAVIQRYANDSHHRLEADDLPDKGDDGFLNREVQRRAEEFMVEKERQRLEEENFLTRLRRKPRKLPYEQARTWVQANLGVDTEAEFHDLVLNGNLRTPYIPKNPQDYYTKTREWISWDHFLGGIFDGKTPSSIRPKTGIFD